MYLRMSLGGYQMRKTIHSIENRYFVKLYDEGTNCDKCSLVRDRSTECFCSCYTDVKCGEGKYYEEVFLIGGGVYNDSKGTNYIAKKIKRHTPFVVKCGELIQIGAEYYKINFGDYSISCGDCPIYSPLGCGQVLDKVYGVSRESCGSVSYTKGDKYIVRGYKFEEVKR